MGASSATVLVTLHESSSVPMTMPEQLLDGRPSGTTKLARVAFALLVLAGLGAEPLSAQPASPSDPSPTLQARSAQFEASIVELAGRLANEPRLRGLSPQKRQERVEFVVGNMIFVAAHELGHAVISELDLPVLAREEDTADVY